MDNQCKKNIEIDEVEVILDAFLQCEACEFVASTNMEFEMHMKAYHMKLRVEIKYDDQKVLPCNECDYKCLLNIQLKKHKEKKHSNKQSESKPNVVYTCKTCNYGSNYIAELWNHIFETHPGNDFKFDKKAKNNMLLNMVAEPNVDVIEEFNHLNRDTKEAFKEMAREFDHSLCTIRDELKEIIVASHNETTNLFKKN